MQVQRTRDVELQRVLRACTTQKLPMLYSLSMPVILCVQILQLTLGSTGKVLRTVLACTYIHYCCLIPSFMAFCRLKTKYREFNTAIGKTGAGLRYQNVEQDSELSNRIGKSLSIHIKSRVTHYIAQSSFWKSFRTGKTCMASGRLYQTLIPTLYHLSLAKILRSKQWAFWDHTRIRMK